MPSYYPQSDFWHICCAQIFGSLIAVETHKRTVLNSFYLEKLAKKSMLCADVLEKEAENRKSCVLNKILNEIETNSIFKEKILNGIKREGCMRDSDLYKENFKFNETYFKDVKNLFINGSISVDSMYNILNIDESLIVDFLK